MVPRNARASPSGEHSTSTTEAADEEVWRRASSQGAPFTKFQVTFSVVSTCSGSPPLWS